MIKHLTPPTPPKKIILELFIFFLHKGIIFCQNMISLQQMYKLLLKTTANHFG